MRYSLPQAATRAKKFQSLDGDTRKIAEELVRKKFKIQEEVVPDRGDFFHNPAVSCNDFSCPTCYGNRGGMGFSRGYDPAWGGDRTASVVRTDITSLDACHKILYKMQREYGPSTRFRKEWLMGRRQFDDLTRDVRSDRAVVFGKEPRLFGIPVVLCGMDTRFIELRYVY